MSDPEPPAESEDAENGGGLGSLLTSTRALIAAMTALVGAVSGLVIALNKVGIIGGDNGAAATTTALTTTMSESEPTSSLFGPITRPNGRVYFDGKTMYVRAAVPRRPLIHLADLENPLGDVAISARARWISGSREYGAGFICRYESNSNYYLLAVLSGGRYNIVRYRDGRLISLTRGIQQTSAFSGDEYAITARCIGSQPTRLTLDVNGHTVGAVEDANGIERGNIGVRVGTGESVVTVSLDDFVLKSL